jgi:hypothetical protein
MFKKVRIPLLVVMITAVASIFVIVSCGKPDSEIIGCVFGKIKGSEYRIPLGCMTKVEFDRYLDSPTGYSSTGQIIDRDLTFKKVADCYECQ